MLIKLKVHALFGSVHHREGDVLEMVDEHRARELVRLGHADWAIPAPPVPTPAPPEETPAGPENAVEPKPRAERAVSRK